MKEAETAFEKTTSLLFGRPLKPLEAYAVWLRRNIPGGRFVKPAQGGDVFFLPDFSVFKLVPTEKAAGLEAVEENSKKMLPDAGDFFRLGKAFGKTASLVMEFKEGVNQNVQESNFYLSNTNTYRIGFCFHTKNSAYNVWSSFNDHSFGCYRNMNGSFCVNCYYSTELTACFEMDACKKCSNSMFCHNCENVNDSLFCYNTQNLRYAVGNRVVGREKFLEIKKKLLEYILPQLEKKNSLDLDIYNLACFRR